MEYFVISVRNTSPHPYAFNDKAEALEFAKGQIEMGLVYTTLWHCDADGVLHPLDLEAVERNLKTEGVWL
jgi:hypothetical protein